VTNLDCQLITASEKKNNKTEGPVWKGYETRELINNAMMAAFAP
jgi:hypothetical protein